MTPLYILTCLAIAGIGFIAMQLHKSQTDGDPRLKAEIEKKNQDIGELKNQMIEMKSEKDKLSGQGKELYDRYKSLEAEYKSTTKERDGLSARVSKFEAESEQRQKRHEDMATKLEEAKAALEDEKVRIRREDEERQQQLIEDRDRMWNDHEQDVVAVLDGLTKKDHCQFTSYSNTNLPEGFSGSLKPDFMISFLEQYIIFDAKVSRSQDLQNYMKESVKKTALKIKGNQKIYSTVFLVVPTDAVATLKQISFYEEGFTFYVVSPEALEPILASLKRMESYEFTEGIDPQERENIVDLVAAFDFHVSTRNAHELQMIYHGLETMHKAQNANPELMAEAMIKKAKMRNLNLSTAETKELVANPKEVAQQLLELVEPKAKITKEDLGKVS
ncbi:MAG: hypothetical protein HOG89_04185 [Candidatus Peribacter sp.]|jgi:hypothetical protein|nr:hypothetical protein [Candidatus Peribacter sp.]MBT4393366.1 hypothetical protein [Candidatus Peribacter sp.]MBT4600795.1 hypothetical protein [Candidatus Peribacter sp.]MBT5149159.1 hypothetical protein [Candidatus Peribacter sp.]MBT5637868.1 hypothetical protein [Candidatus Peribacter sp.]